MINFMTNFTLKFCKVIFELHVHDNHDKLKPERFQSVRSNRTTFDGDVSGTCFVWQETYKSKETNLIEFQSLLRTCDVNDPRTRLPPSDLQELKYLI